MWDFEEKPRIDSHELMSVSSTPALGMCVRVCVCVLYMYVFNIHI